MILLVSIIAVVGFVLIYALWLRNWLKQQPWAGGFFEAIEPIERVLYKKSETILVARMTAALGGFLTLLTQLGQIDFTPIIPFVPEKYQWMVTALINSMPLIISLFGMIVEKLRNQTTLPLEVVALPDKVSADVAVAVQAAVTATKDVVATVRDDKVIPTPELLKVEKPNVSTEPPKAGG